VIQECENGNQRLLRLRDDPVGIWLRGSLFRRHKNVTIGPSLLGKTHCEQLVNNKKYVVLVSLPSVS